MKQFAFVSRRRAWYILSSTLVICSIISLAVFGLRPGLDFTGGSLLEISYSADRPSRENITAILAHTVSGSVIVQHAGDSGAIIRMQHISEEDHQRVLEALQADSGSITITEDRFESFGPSLGKELQRKSFYAILVVLAAIIAYISYAFRKVSQPVPSWQFGAVAVIALIHDTVIVLGVFSLLGAYFGTEVNSFFITALLTLLGFSVHDTIVTLDRVRENLVVLRDVSFSDLVNRSINETILRSLNTSLTTVLTLSAIYLIGGESIRDLSLALIVGIIVGTYSSVFLAAPMLVSIQSRKK